jgi:hypothetical protein
MPEFDAAPQGRGPDADPDAVASRKLPADPREPVDVDTSTLPLLGEPVAILGAAVAAATALLASDVAQQLPELARLILTVFVVAAGAVLARSRVTPTV